MHHFAVGKSNVVVGWVDDDVRHGCHSCLVVAGCEGEPVAAGFVAGEVVVVAAPVAGGLRVPRGVAGEAHVLGFGHACAPVVVPWIRLPQTHVMVPLTG